MHHIQYITKNLEVCEDKEDWCTLGPDCSYETVKERCPKLCNICDCVDQKVFCMYGPDCTKQKTKEVCRKSCNLCNGKPMIRNRLKLF